MFSNWVMMNKETRRLSKFPEEVRAEIGPYFRDQDPVIGEDNRKLPKLNDDNADHVRRGLTVSCGSARGDSCDTFCIGFVCLFVFSVTSILLNITLILYFRT